MLAKSPKARLGAGRGLAHDLDLTSLYFLFLSHQRLLESTKAQGRTHLPPELLQPQGVRTPSCEVESPECVWQAQRDDWAGDKAQGQDGTPLLLRFPPPSKLFRLPWDEQAAFQPTGTQASAGPCPFPFFTLYS